MRYRSSGLFGRQKNLRHIIQNQMSVSLYSNGQLANNTRGSWISTTAFNDDFFSYTTTVNPTTFQTTGSLGAVTGADGSTCPAGRVLRENGKKLYPAAHNGVSTYMIGVFDPVSFLSGFIDPNSTIFAVYNSNKPASLDTTLLAGGVNPNGGAADLAPPIYTAGTVTALGQVRSSTVTPLTSAATVTIDVSLGQVFKITPGEDITFSVSNHLPGDRFTLIITTTSSSRTLTFTGGSDLYATGTLTTGTTAARIFTISFISDGLAMYEVSRTAIQAS
jgi:hypothetical protein